MEYIKSPMNYIGGKYKLLPDLFKIFPDNIDTFVDLFAGGFNVGVNVTANTIICNDQIKYLPDLYRCFKDLDYELLISEIQNRINEFNLSKENRDGYLTLRDIFNTSHEIIDFFVLVCYSFNNQIRFNSKGEFNMPFGKDRSSFNKSIETNLSKFCDALKTKNIIFSNNNFINVDIKDNSFVYCDPPYLITTAPYNDGKGWGKNEDLQLFSFLDNLNVRGIKFAMSNVLYHRGLSNDGLIEWSKKYNIHFLDKSYANCNYHVKDKQSKTIEVVITNY